MPPGPPNPVEIARAHLKARRPSQALAALQRHVQRHPDDADACHLMGLALAQTYQPEQAEYFLRRAAELAPDRAQFQAVLGNILGATGRAEEAMERFRRALAINPQHFNAHLGLSNVLWTLDRLEEAEAHARAAIAVGPQRFEGYGNLATVLRDAGRIDECQRVLNRALELAPHEPTLRAAALAVLLYSDRSTPRQVSEAHAAYGRLVSAGVPAAPVRVHDPDPERPLRIAYLSPDFRTNSVAYFIEAPLEHHDRERYPVTCYSTNPTVDAVTERLRPLADAWVQVDRLNDQQLVERLRADRIDVLVELSGHMIGGRVRALARRAAPVQVTAIGYPATTGVPAIDYRIVDSTTDPADPPTEADRHATERLVRLDPCFLCYKPPPDAPDVAPPPSRDGGPVTFGSFNTQPKIVPATIDLWARILREAPGSRLLLKNKPLGDASVRRRLEAQFAERGVEPSRLELRGRAVGLAEHLGLYARVDIALDTFPYHGTTTTCEAMWMGVPVVTLEGVMHAGRVGPTLLWNVGLADLIARTPDEYVALAAALARDPARLASLRASLRDRMRASPLCDGPGYARRLEAAYREMWRARCAETARA